MKLLGMRSKRSLGACWNAFQEEVIERRAKRFLLESMNNSNICTKKEEYVTENTILLSKRSERMEN